MSLRHKLSQYDFEEDQPKRKWQEATGMEYVLNFGKFKGKKLGEIMKTQPGRNYIKWLRSMPNEEPQFKDAYERRNANLDECLELYEFYLQEKKQKK